MGVVGILVIVFLGAGLLARIAEPILRNWGSVPEERQRPLPGDELLQKGWTTHTRAIDIGADQRCVWRWLQQIGQGRGGFYSYTQLENIFGLRIRNARTIHPEWQQIEVGELIRLHPGGGMVVWDILRPQYILLAGTPETMKGLPIQQEPKGSWLFYLEPINTNQVRLLIRSAHFCGQHPLLRFFLKDLLMVITFIMERKMLLNIKRLAEAEGCHAPKLMEG